MIQNKNDELRHALYNGTPPGHAEFFYSKGVQQLPANVLFGALEQIATYDNFDTERHERGSVEVDGHVIDFCIDYYDESMQYSSGDPRDFEKPYRILTVALQQEDLV